MSTTGELIKSARERRGWRRSELSRRSGVDRGQITRIEGGDRTGSITTIVKLASVLDLDLNLLKLDALADAPTVSE